MEHLSHLVGAYSRIIHLDCLFAYLFRILSPLCFRRICLFAMSADIPLRSAARESHLPLLCCCSAFRAFLLFLFHASIISLLLTFCQLPMMRSRRLDGGWEFSPYNPVLRTRSADERWLSAGHATPLPRAGRALAFYSARLRAGAL